MCLYLNCKTHGNISFKFLISWMGFLRLLNNFCISRSISQILYLTFINWHLGVFMVCILVMSNIGRKESDFKLDFWHFDLLPSLSKLWQILHLKMFRLGSREACVPISSLDQILLIGSFCPSTSPRVWMYLVQNDIQNIEMFIKFFDTGHCTHTYPDYMRNGEPLKTVRRIDTQISQFDFKHVFSGFK